MTKELILRSIRSNDNATLATIIRNVFIEHDAPQHGTVYSDPTIDDLFQLFDTPKSILWVAEWQGKIVGCCGIYPTEGLEPTCVELVKFYIHQAARGKGIGRALMEKCTESALDFGYQQLYIESLPDFARAVNMYEKQGFQLLDKPLANSGHTTCDIWMVKYL